MPRGGLGLTRSLPCYRSPLHGIGGASAHDDLSQKLAPLWLAGIRLNVLFGCAVDQRQNFVLDRLDRRHGRAPLRSVPLDERFPP